MTALVGYRVLTKDGGPANVAGLAYDYVLAAGGVYLSAENAALNVTVQIAAGVVRGLEAAHPGLDLKPGRIPNSIWRAIRQVCTGAAGRGQEAMCEVTYDGQGYTLVVPRQVRSGVAVEYRPSERCVLHLHSHHRMPTYFSATDDADEQGLALYGVLGRLGLPDQQPEVALRVGAYGAFAGVPWDLVFAGDIDDVRDCYWDRARPAASGDPAPCRKDLPV